MTDARSVAALLDGPPPLTPERVTEQTCLWGRRIIVSGNDGEWHRDIRACSDPYWMDSETLPPLRWQAHHPVPEGADVNRADLYVSACTEKDWYEWRRTKRRPKVVEYPATVVWVE